MEDSCHYQPGEGYKAGDKLSWNFNTPWRIAIRHNGNISLEDDNGDGVVGVDGTSGGHIASIGSRRIIFRHQLQWKFEI